MTDFTKQHKQVEKVRCNFKVLDGSHSPINCVLKNPPTGILYGYWCDGKECIFQMILKRNKETK